MNATKFSALRHAVKLKHEIELLELDIVEFVSGNLPKIMKDQLLESREKELNMKKINLLKFVENNDLSKIIFENTRINEPRRI